MDWFLYDRDLRHERVNSGNQLAKFGETLQLKPQFLDALLSSDARMLLFNANFSACKLIID